MTVTIPSLRERAAALVRRETEEAEREQRERQQEQKRRAAVTAHDFCLQFGIPIPGDLQIEIEGVCLRAASDGFVHIQHRCPDCGRLWDVDYFRGYHVGRNWQWDEPMVLRGLAGIWSGREHYGAGRCEDCADHEHTKRSVGNPEPTAAERLVDLIREIAREGWD